MGKVLVIEPSDSVRDMYEWYVQEDGNTQWYKARHRGLTFTVWGARYAAYRSLHLKPKRRYTYPITKTFPYDSQA